MIFNQYLNILLLNKKFCNIFQDQKEVQTRLNQG